MTVYKFISTIVIILVMSLSKASTNDCQLNIAATSFSPNKLPIKAMSLWDKKAVTLQFDTLLRYDENLNLTPWLAKHWYFSKDKLTLTLILRTGVTFSDKSPVDSLSVENSLKKFTSIDSIDFDRTKLIKSITRKANKITIRFSQPFIQFIYYLATPRSSIFKEYSNGKIVGSGPWIFKKSNNTGLEYSHMFEANEDYFMQHRGCKKLQIIEIIQNQQKIAFNQGKIDLIEYYSAINEDMDALKSSLKRDIKIIEYPAYDVTSIFFTLNNSKNLTLNQRQILKKYISEQKNLDKTTLINKSLSFIPAGILKNTKENLNSSLKNEHFKFSLYSINDSRLIYLEQIKQNLKTKMIDLNIKPLEISELYRLHKENQVSAHVESLTMQIPDPYGILSMYISNSKENFSHYSNKVFDKIMRRASSENDNIKRQALYNKAWKILENSAMIIPLYSQIRLSIIDKNFDGYNTNLIGPFYSTYHNIYKVNNEH